MNKKHEAISFIHRLKHVTLSEDSRTTMRESLAAYADLHEITAPRPHPITPSIVTILLHSRKAAAGALAVLVLLIGTVPTAIAAEGAVPGDALYAVKIHVNEPIATALAVSPEADARTETKLALRRAKEAEVLAERGALTEEKAAYLAEKFEAHVEKVDDNAEELEATGKFAVSLAVRSEIAEEIEKHTAALDEKVAVLEDEESKQRVRSFVERLDTRTRVLASAREHIEEVLAIRVAADTDVQTSLATAQTAPKAHTADSRLLLPIPDSAAEALSVTATMLATSSLEAQATSTPTTTEETSEQESEDDTPLHVETPAARFLFPFTRPPTDSSVGDILRTNAF